MKLLIIMLSDKKISHVCGKGEISTIVSKDNDKNIKYIYFIYLVSKKKFLSINEITHGKIIFNF